MEKRTTDEVQTIRMQEHDSVDFRGIVKGCCLRKRSSQNALYRLYYPYGMSICIRYVNNEAEAISVVNDGFLKVFRNISKYDEKQAFKPWFRKILVNTAINHVKKQKKIQMETSIDQISHLSSQEEILSRINYQELLNMIQSLSTSYRTVFNMYVIDGFKHQEIAEVLGITVSTSKSNLTRARAKLQELVTAKLNNPYV